eukprot:5451283-Amphidinium_carterae.1
MGFLEAVPSLLHGIKVWLGPVSASVCSYVPLDHHCLSHWSGGVGSAQVNHRACGVLLSHQVEHVLGGAEGAVDFHREPCVSHCCTEELQSEIYAAEATSWCLPLHVFL